MSDKKKFGLVMPKKTDTLKTKINSVFNDESDEEGHSKKRPKIPQKVIKKSSIKAESDIDPTIYEYDSIYDEMKAKQAESSGPKEAKSSRYIETLLKAADKRKKEYERRIDRKIQIEREKEGDQYKDKEAFVTSSYKKKLQEKEEEEERERRENMLNDMMDVTKQKDLSGFYRHFLNQSVGEEKIPLFGEKQIKKEIESDQDSTADKVDEKINAVENLDQDSDGIEIDNEDDDSERDFSSHDDEVKIKKTFKKKTSLYRDGKNSYKRQKSDCNMSENLEKSESPKQNKTCIRKPSINSDSDSSDYEDNKSTKNSLHMDKDKDKNEKSMNKLNSRHDSSSSDDEHNKNANLEVETDASKEEKQKNIYAKRTIGDVFAEAQARYFQRMAMRNS